MLSAGIAVAFAVPEVKSQLGPYSPWVTPGAIAAFVTLVGIRVIWLESENRRLGRSRPNLTVTLPDPTTIGAVDSCTFEIAVSNEPDFAASLQTRVFVQEVHPPSAHGIRLPAHFQGWSEDISPSETAHCAILRIQHGSVSGNPRAEAVCDLSTGFLSLDLIHGAEQYEIFYRVTATNLLRGVDFHCAMKRRVMNLEYVWDVTWEFGAEARK